MGISKVFNNPSQFQEAQKLSNVGGLTKDFVDAVSFQGGLGEKGFQTGFLARVYAPTLTAAAAAVAAMPVAAGGGVQFSLRSVAVRCFPMVGARCYSLDKQDTPLFSAFPASFVGCRLPDGCAELGRMLEEREKGEKEREIEG